MKASTSKHGTSSTNNPFDGLDAGMMEPVSLAQHSEMLGGAGAVTFDSAYRSPNNTETPTTTKTDAPAPNNKTTTNNTKPQETDAERKKRHRHYNGLAKQELLAYADMQHRLDWTSVPYVEKTGITCDELPVTADGKYTFRASGVVKGKKAQEIAERHLDCKAFTRLVWDKELSHIELLEEVARDDRAGIVMTCQRATHHPPIVSDREFVYIQFSFSEPSTANKFDRKWTLLVSSVDHPLAPENNNNGHNNKQFVRALMMSMMVLEPFSPTKDPATGQSIPNTAVTLFGWVNPGGFIPPAIVTLYKTKLADRIQFLRDTAFMDEAHLVHQKK